MLLSAVGLAITFGVMGVVLLAHGELMMLVLYHALCDAMVRAPAIGHGFIVIHFLPRLWVAGLVGIAIERGVIRHLYGRPLETLLATFGISLILQQAVCSIFFTIKSCGCLPEWMSGSLVINPVWSITYNRLYIFGFSLVVFAVLLIAAKRTTLWFKVTQWHKIVQWRVRWCAC